MESLAVLSVREATVNVGLRARKNFCGQSPPVRMGVDIS